METHATNHLAEWSRVRARLLERFTELTLDDLELVVGREETLLETIAAKTGCSRQTVVDAFRAHGIFRIS